MHEILTLQLGQRSNYLATHFWNAQESYFTYSVDQESIIDHDIHFRPGIGVDGTETFTPRTLIYDLKGGFGTLKRLNALYEVDEPVVPQGLWNGPTIVQRQLPIGQNTYQQSLDEGVEPPPLTTQSVRYWSDFNRVFFHPRSIVQLNEYELSSTIMPFEAWNVGEELFSSLDKEHDLLDRDLRPFAEEADHMQGIQMIAEVDDAWGGFAARYIDRIRDEYGKTAITFWGVEDGLTTIPREKRFLKLSNVARSIAEISPQASLFVPMTVPSAKLPSYVSIDPKSQWHVSALLATALESMNLPSRLKSHENGHETMDQLVSALNINSNQNIAKLRMSIDHEKELNGHHDTCRLDPRTVEGDFRAPLHERHTVNISEDRDDELSTLDMEFFPSEVAEQARGSRRIKKSHVFGQAENYRSDNDRDNDETNQMDEGYERARRRAAGLPIIQNTSRTRIPLSFPLLDSFPHIFAQPSPGSSSLSVSTSLSTDTSVALRMKSLQNVVGRAVSLDEREALSNTLGELAEAYEEGWDSGSDEDDD